MSYANKYASDVWSSVAVRMIANGRTRKTIIGEVTNIVAKQGREIEESNPSKRSSRVQTVNRSEASLERLYRYGTSWKIIVIINL